VHELNDEIRDKEIRLIGSEGEQLGIMAPFDALRIADEQGLDLVKISPQAKPPVCKLMNYGKFRFEQGKREKEAKKNQHVVEIKEIRMSPGIDIGDFNTKLKNAQKFIADGDRVKVTVRFRGREMAHTDIGGSFWLGSLRSVPKPLFWTRPPRWRDGCCPSSSLPRRGSKSRV
jgi:translation initiation factor IF-3